MKSLLWGVLLSGLGALSCGSGQTGSASCAILYSCECQRVGGQYLAKGKLVDLHDEGNGTLATVEIEAVLNPDAAFGADDVHRQIFGRATLTAQDLKGPCSTGAVEAPPVVGSEVLVTFPTYSIQQSECAQCDAQCTAACAPERTSEVIQANMAITPWAEDAVEVGNGTALSLSDAVTLSDLLTCSERYPSPRAGQCNDTRAEADGCALAATTRSTRLPWGFAALLAIATGVWRRRHR